jgi:hypothetical protein
MELPGSQEDTRYCVVVQVAQSPHTRSAVCVQSEATYSSAEHVVHGVDVPSSHQLSSDTHTPLQSK